MSFSLGFLLIYFLWNILFLTTCFYILGISITPIVVFLSFLSCFILHFRYSREVKKSMIMMCALFLIVILVLLFCGSVYDSSWDGNNYQKSIIGMLAYGWNPIYLTYDEAANLSSLFSINEWSTWFDAYPKASSIIAAAFYTVTGNIESGKAYTLLSCISGILILIGLLNKKRTKVNRKTQLMIILISMSLYFNPVSISQCITFYNDAFLWNMIFITVFACVYLTTSERTQYDRACFALIFLCIGIGFNVKFSALLYFALICGSFYFYWIYKAFKCSNIKRNSIIKKLTLFYVITVIFSLCFLGSTSYVKNTVIHHNPVYTMIGEGKSEIIDSQAPIAFQSLSRSERFIASIFSESSNNMLLEDVKLKLPFSITSSEKETYWPDARINGWGTLYSGMLILSLLSFIIAWRKLIISEYKVCLMMLLLISFVAPVIIPGLFWARYWMILFLIPCIAMCLTNITNYNKIISIVLLALSVGNIILPTQQVISNIEVSQKTKIEYTKLQLISEKDLLAIKLGADEFVFNGLVFNLMDSDISNYYIDNNLESYEYISAGQGRIFYKVVEQNDET